MHQAQHQRSQGKLAEEVQWIAQRLAAVPDLTLAEVRGDLPSVA